VYEVVGDRFGGEFVREPFRLHGVTYELADRPKSDFYRDLLPLVNSGKIELLDHPRLVAQLCGLERWRSGKNSIDHAPGGHDDVANAVAGSLVLAAGGLAPIVYTPEMVAEIRAFPAWRGARRKRWRAA
jgi:hypothetical protein